MLKKIVFPLAVVLVALAAVSFAVFKAGNNALPSGIDVSVYEKIAVFIGGEQFSAFVADTDALREQGLSGFTGLEEREAMLFKFNASDRWGFWMKDMLFPIDIVWISEDMSIVSIMSNATPESFPRVFYPDGLSRYVIELPAGSAEQLGLEAGEKVNFR